MSARRVLQDGFELRPLPIAPAVQKAEPAYSADHHQHSTTRSRRAWPGTMDLTVRVIVCTARSCECCRVRMSGGFHEKRVLCASYLSIIYLLGVPGAPKTDSTSHRGKATCCVCVLRAVCQAVWKSCCMCCMSAHTADTPCPGLVVWPYTTYSTYSSMLYVVWHTAIQHIHHTTS